MEELDNVEITAALTKQPEKLEAAYLKAPVGIKLRIRNNTNETVILT